MLSEDEIQTILSLIKEGSEWNSCWWKRFTGASHPLFQAGEEWKEATNRVEVRFFCENLFPSSFLGFLHSEARGSRKPFWIQRKTNWRSRDLLPSQPVDRGDYHPSIHRCQYCETFTYMSKSKFSKFGMDWWWADHQCKYYRFSYQHVVNCAAWCSQADFEVALPNLLLHEQWS